MKKRIARILPLLVVLTLAFAATGCLVAVEDVDLAQEEPMVRADLTPEELMEKVVEAYGKVATYHADTEMAMQIRLVAAKETTEGCYQMRTHSIADIINQRMMTSITTKMTMPPPPGLTQELPMETEIKIHWLDGLVYLNLPLDPPDMRPVWLKLRVCFRERISPLKQVVELLKVSEIDVLGMEEINGAKSYLIKVTPDLAKLWEVLNEGVRAKMVLDWTAPWIPPIWNAHLEEVFQEVSIKKWIAGDTFFVVKQKLYLTMALEGMEIKMSSIARFHSFNEPLAIELPPGAEEAAIWGPGAASPPP